VATLHVPTEAPADLPIRQADATDPNSLAPRLVGHDAVISASRFVTSPNNAVNWLTQRNYGFSDAAFLAVVAHVVLVEVSDTIWMQIVVSVLGIALMTLLAYYRSWSKEADKKPAKGFISRASAPPA
jgi:OpgC protein